MDAAQIQDIPRGNTHFEQWLERIQPKNVQIPNHVFLEVREWLNENGFTAARQVSREDCRKALKHLALRMYYEHDEQIHRRICESV